MNPAGLGTERQVLFRVLPWIPCFLGKCTTGHTEKSHHGEPGEHGEELLTLRVPRVLRGVLPELGGVRASPAFSCAVARPRSHGGSVVNPPGTPFTNDAAAAPLTSQPAIPAHDGTGSDDFGQTVPL